MAKGKQNTGGQWELPPLDWEPPTVADWNEPILLDWEPIPPEQWSLEPWAFEPWELNTEPWTLEPWDIAEDWGDFLQGWGDIVDW